MWINSFSGPASNGYLKNLSFWHFHGGFKTCLLERFRGFCYLSPEPDKLSPLFPVFAKLH